MSAELAAALNIWRLAQNPTPTPTEAIHRLLRIALNHEGIPVGGQLDQKPQDDDPVARLVSALKAARVRQ